MGSVPGKGDRMDQKTGPCREQVPWAAPRGARESRKTSHGQAVPSSADHRQELGFDAKMMGNTCFRQKFDMTRLCGRACRCRGEKRSLHVRALVCAGLCLSLEVGPDRAEGRGPGTTSTQYGLEENQPPQMSLCSICSSFFLPVCAPGRGPRPSP